MRIRIHALPSQVKSYFFFFFQSFLPLKDKQNELQVGTGKVVLIV
jgi:hypothetical protein